MSALKVFDIPYIPHKISGCGKHGRCIGPNQCACEIGWQGSQCDTCIPLPGCLNGHCESEPFECICNDPLQWRGPLCNLR